MKKPEIISLLTENHNRFIQPFESMNENQFLASANDKWNSSQQLDHIIRAVSPVVLAFSLPSFIPRLMFGKANRPSKTFEALVEKYHAKLAAGGQASGQFIPKNLTFVDRDAAIQKLKSLVQKLNKHIAGKSEEALDTFILPHPLLGKLTFREMLYFTAYHAEHHRKNTERNLQGIV